MSQQFQVYTIKNVCISKKCMYKNAYNYITYNSPQESTTQMYNRTDHKKLVYSHNGLLNLQKYLERSQTQKCLQYDSHMKFQKRQILFLGAIGRGWAGVIQVAPGLLEMFCFFDLSSGYTCSVCDNLMILDLCTFLYICCISIRQLKNVVK